MQPVHLISRLTLVSIGVGLALATQGANAASGGLFITEVDPTGSSTAPYNADWFELTNTGTSAVNLAGWKMDDNSNSFAAAVALRGVTSIGAGQSVVFIEGGSTSSGDAALESSFVSAWFGANAPANFTIGAYGGSGVGLSSTTDAVNVFDASGATMARVDFNASTAGYTFDNAALKNNVTLTQLSAAGTNGAFRSAVGTEIGSPGTITAAVPEPASFGFALIGLAGLTFVARRRSL